MGVRSPFFGAAALAFVGAVVDQFLLFQGYASQISSPLVILGFGLCVALIATGVVLGVRKTEWTESVHPVVGVVRFVGIALTGVSFTLVSFFCQNGIGFENQDTGYPLVFALRTAFNGLGPVHLELLPASLDFGFWLAMSYLFVSGVPFRSTILRGSLEAIAGIALGLFIPFLVIELVYQNSGLSTAYIIPIFFALDSVLAYAQIKRGLKLMGLSIIAVGMVLVLAFAAEVQ